MRKNCLKQGKKTKYWCKIFSLKHVVPYGI